MLSFVFSFEKKNRNNLGQCESHNTRHHPTKSQLPKSAWFGFGDDGDYTVTDWDSKKLDLAKSLSKRKDAILAIEFVIAIGNQSDWRNAPTEEHPYGEPKAGMLEIIQSLAYGAKEAAEKEFGAENVVGVNLHLDESTPHVHVVVTPIRDGKLQAKHWTGGVKACEELRERMWFSVNKATPCSYVRGNDAGGEPHDATKAAGAPSGPKAEKIGFLAAGAALLDLRIQVKDLGKKVLELSRRVASLFSSLKKSEIKRKKDKEAAADALSAMHKSARDQEQSHSKKMTLLAKNYDEKVARLESSLTEQRSMNDTLAKRNNELLLSAARNKFAT
jgi:hypothetical protein